MQIANIGDGGRVIIIDLLGFRSVINKYYRQTEEMHQFFVVITYQHP